MQPLVGEGTIVKDFNEFVSYWDKEADELKNREITENDSQLIHLTFASAKLRLSTELNLDRTSFERSEHRKLRLLEDKLDVSLAMATSKYRSNHITIWERLIENIGGIFKIFSSNGK